MGASSEERAAEARRAMQAGNAAWAAGKPEEAAKAFARAALLRPETAGAHGNLGVALRRLGLVEAAVASYGRALALTPDDPGLLSNAGNALRELGRLEEAETRLRRAAELAPGNASIAYNLALALRDRRLMGESLALMERLAKDQPDNGDIAWDLALTQLQMKDYAAGFEGYEARWRLTRSPPRHFPGPRWLPGMDIGGRTVFLHAEQGFGDALQFARFVPEAARLGARIVLECQPELMELMAGLPGVAQVVEKNAPPPPHDLWAPMLSLPRLLGVTWDSLPTEVPYLAPPPNISARIDRAPGTALRVGLVWAGKTTPRDRSWPLDKLLPLMEDPRLAFYSLQKGPRRDDLARLGAGALMRDLSPRLDSFAATAAAMAQLDLIITIDSAPAHLAGALGRPVWVLLRYVSDWRWLDEPEDCAWYPTMRLFRQPDPMDFDTPVRRLAEALRALLDGAKAPGEGFNPT